VSLQGDRVHLKFLTEEHVNALVAAAGESRDTYVFTNVPGAEPGCYVVEIHAEDLIGRQKPKAGRTED
jgi:hypothetical protein